MLDVMILNAYHRGDWLIEQYKGTQYAVETLDISEVIGHREAVDLNGPFGIYSEVDAATQEWLLKNRQTSTQNQGWVLWSNEGTFESNGHFTSYQLENLKESADTVLKSWMSTTDRPAPLLRSSPSMIAATLRPALMSRNFNSEPEKRRTVKATDSFSVTSVPSHKVIQWNEHKFDAHYVVSFLLPHELMARASVGLNQLLTTEPLRPRVGWQRARFRVETKMDIASLPDQLCLVPRLHEPLVEENFLVIQKTSQTNEIDIWFRSWFEMHKDKKYFSTIQKRLQSVLLDKFPDAIISCMEAPLETTEKAAYTLFPIYDLQEWSLNTKFYNNGIFYGAQDKCEDFTFEQMIEAQRRIFKQIDQELKGG